MEEVINALMSSIFEENEEEVRAYEKILVSNINKIADIPAFYELPTENLFRIIEKSKTTDVETIEKLVFNTSMHKGKEAPLILNVIDIDDASLEDNIRILSNLRSCRICKHIHDILDRDKNLPKRDYEGEINDLKEELSSHKKEKESGFGEFKEDFVDDIFIAAEKGSTKNVKYLINERKIDVETRNEIGMTPLNVAAYNGRTELVRLLVDDLHADINTKDDNGDTPLSNASFVGHIEVINFLLQKGAKITFDVNTFGRNPEVKDILMKHSNI